MSQCRIIDRKSRHQCWQKSRKAAALLRIPAYPVHEAGSARRSPVPGLAKGASRELSMKAMTA
jgi:hypothetical protein